MIRRTIIVAWQTRVSVHRIAAFLSTTAMFATLLLWGLSYDDGWNRRFDKLGQQTERLASLTGYGGQLILRSYWSGVDIPLDRPFRPGTDFAQSMKDAAQMQGIPLYTERRRSFMGALTFWGRTVGFGCPNGDSWTCYGITKFIYVEVPFWMLFVVLAAYPIVALIRGPLRRWRRRRKGLCVTCGYNLTGNVTGTCPECGTEVKQP